MDSLGCPQLSTTFDWLTRVWDTKRQIIWLSTAVIFGTFVVYQHARDEAEGFDPAYFALLEIILLIVIAAMFYFYSRSSKS